MDGRSIPRRSNRRASQALTGWVSSAAQKRCKGPPTNCSEDGTDLPALSQALPDVRNCRQAVYAAHVEIQSNVVIAQPVVVSHIRITRTATSVADLSVVACSAAIHGVGVETLAPSQVVLRVQTVESTLVERHLHAVVLRITKIGCLDDVPERLVWKLSGKWAEWIAI